MDGGTCLEDLILCAVCLLVLFHLAKQILARTTKESFCVPTEEGRAHYWDHRHSNGKGSSRVLAQFSPHHIELVIFNPR
jgi:hypothetical protein